jgi:hypothetical protein
MKKIVLASLALALGWGGTAFAQTEVDALRYTQLGVAGSARTQGIGGAQTALGADVSNLSSNPAGLGMFRRSEISLTPAIQFSTTDTNTGSMRQSNERNMLTIPQAGIIISNRKGDEDVSDWRGINFGIGVTRLNNFNEQLFYQNTAGEDQATIVEYFAERANNNGRTRSDLDSEFNSGFVTLEGLAYGAYLIDIEEDEATGEQFAVPLFRAGAILEDELIQRRGAQNQIDIGAGTSFRDKIYLGASVGIISSRFTQESLYNETESDATTEFTNLELRDEFTTRGTGVNLKVGIIARPTDALRIGASVQTPTAYTLTDTYQRSLYAFFDDGTTESASEIPGDISYRMTTPFRATGGVAVFLGKYGFITGDIEYVDYSNTRFEEDDEFGSGTSSFYSNLNNSISNTYQSAMNYRIGAEGRYEAFRFRAGYAHSGNPYRSSGLNGAINSFSLGAGVRLQNYYADLAFVNSTRDSRYSPYQLSSGDEPVVDISNTQRSVLLTVGYNF